jgi:LAS superfamily LD-carboxypeptidase LdcB
MAIQVIPVIIPTANGPLINGKLTPCQLTAVYFPGVGHLSLYPTAARALNAMALQCHADTGATLSTTGTYRTYDQQVQLFNQRMSPTYNPVTCTTTTRVWNGKKYWLKRGKAPCAVPGNSNHGLGLADDMGWWIGGGKPVQGITSNSAGWKWIQDHAVSYGFSWEGDLAGPNFEPWHIRYVLGDKVSPAVLATEKKLGMKPAK